MSLVRTVVFGLIGCVASAGSASGDEQDAGTKPLDVGRAASEVRLVMPASIPAVEGIECNLYFDNLVLVARPGSVLFDVVCAKGRQQAERWTWVPTDADIGSHPLELIVRDDNSRRITSASCTINVVAARHGAGQSLTMLMIGDSLTHAATSIVSSKVCLRDTPVLYPIRPPGVECIWCPRTPKSNDLDALDGLNHNCRVPLARLVSARDNWQFGQPTSVVQFASRPDFMPDRLRGITET